MKLAYKIIEEHYNTPTAKGDLIEEQVSLIEGIIVRNAKNGRSNTKILSESIAPKTIHYFENQGFLVSVSDCIVELDLPLVK